MHDHAFGVETLPDEFSFEEEQTPQQTTEKQRLLPRLLLGGAVVVLVAVCVTFGFLLEQKTKPVLSEQTTVGAFTFAEQDEEDDTPTLQPTAENAVDSYAMTDAFGVPCGTFCVLSVPEQSIQEMEHDVLCSLWDEGARSEALYTTVRFSGGDGLMFSKCNVTTAVYGTIDENACVETVKGMLVRAEDGTLTDLPKAEMTVTESTVTQSADDEFAIADSVSPAADDDAPDHQTSETVYITASGTKFHRGDCYHLHASKIAISRKEAMEKGYTACSQCNP